MRRLAAGLDAHDVEDRDLLWRAFADTFSLPGDLQRSMAACPEIDPQAIRAVVDEAKEVLYIAAQNFTNDASLQVSEATLTRLGDWSFRLRQSPNEVSLDAGTLQSISEAIEDVRRVLDQQTDLEPDIEQFIRDQLAVFSQAIWDVRIRGAAALRDALDMAVGATIRTRSLNGLDTNDPKDVRNRFWDVVSKVADAIQVVTFTVPMVLAITAGSPEPPALEPPPTKPYVIPIPPASPPPPLLARGMGIDQGLTDPASEDPIRKI